MVTQLARGQARITNWVSGLFFQNFFQSFVFISFPLLNTDTLRSLSGEALRILIGEFFTGRMEKVK